MEQEKKSEIIKLIILSLPWASYIIIKFFYSIYSRLAYSSDTYLAPALFDILQIKTFLIFLAPIIIFGLIYILKGNKISYASFIGFFISQLVTGFIFINIYNVDTGPLGVIYFIPLQWIWLGAYLFLRRFSVKSITVLVLIIFLTISSFYIYQIIKDPGAQAEDNRYLEMVNNILERISKPDEIIDYCNSYGQKENHLTFWNVPKYWKDACLLKSVDVIRQKSLNIEDSDLNKICMELIDISYKEECLENIRAVDS